MRNLVLYTPAKMNAVFSYLLRTDMKIFKIILGGVIKNMLV